MKNVVILLTLFLASVSQAQLHDTIIESIMNDSLAETYGTEYNLMMPNDYIFGTLIAKIVKNDINTLPIGSRVSEIGKIFLYQPYIDKSLEVGNDTSETVCNFKGFDCVTFFETSWALATTIKTSYTHSFPDYANVVTNHRYRGGVRNGFQSRLHYTSDYFYDNAQRGNLKEVTKSIGGKTAKLETKPINFMTSHPNLYPQLQGDATMVVKMNSIEQMMRARGGFYYIPKENVAKIEKGIHTGDLIGITTSIAGIDCSHTGIAIKGKDKRVFFMHASSAMHKVIISPIPLADYLAGNSKQTGIMIYRPIEVK